MPLKFTLEEKPIEAPAEPAQPAPSPDTSAADLEAFRGSVVTMRLLGEEHDVVKARILKGQDYLRANVKLPTVKGWLEQALELPYEDERAAAIGQRVAKLQPALGPAINLLMELRAKIVDLNRRVGLEADMQHDLEQRLTGGDGHRYVCTQCFRVMGEHGQCRCWEEGAAG
jgi:hypothetical protein